jgi:tetratricopeptide (TPR) repeat protein
MNPAPKLSAAVWLLVLLLFGISAASAADEEDASAHVIRGEVALHGGKYRVAAGEFLRAAEISDDPEIARKATKLAFEFRFNDMALEAAERWADLDPGSDEALIHVAQLQLRDGDIRASRRTFNELIERGDQPPDERLFALMPFISQEDPANADELMRSLAKRYEDSALAQYAAAAMALQADDVEFAMAAAERSMELDPDWLKPKLLYGRAMLVAGDVDEAIDYTARLVGDDPDPDPDARMELAVMYMTAGQPDYALSQVNQVLLERANRTDALRMMAIINFNQGNLDAAWDDFEDLLQSGEFQYRMDALFYLAQISEVRGEIDDAIELYSNVRQGKNAVASQRRAAQLRAWEKNDLVSALDQLTVFAKEQPAHAIDVLLVKAGLLASFEQYDDALELFDQAVAYRPDSEAIALSRAELLLTAGRLDDAVAAYRKAAKRWPDSSMTLNALGYTLADRTDEYREAEKYIRKALKYEPESPAIIDSLGWVLHKLGENEEALKHLEIAYERFPDAEVAAHIVEVLAALDRDDEALEFLAKAEEKDPDSDKLQDVRERIFPDSD